MGIAVDEAEFLTMLDAAFDDGRKYPTLDDYSKALDTIQRRELTQLENRVVDVSMAANDVMVATNSKSVGRIRPWTNAHRLSLRRQFAATESIKRKRYRVGVIKHGSTFPLNEYDDFAAAADFAKTYRRHQAGKVIIFDADNNIEVAV